MWQCANHLAQQELEQTQKKSMAAHRHAIAKQQWGAIEEQFQHYQATNRKRMADLQATYPAPSRTRESPLSAPSAAAQLVKMELQQMKQQVNRFGTHTKGKTPQLNRNYSVRILD